MNSNTITRKRLPADITDTRQLVLKLMDDVVQDDRKGKKKLEEEEDYDVSYNGVLQMMQRVQVRDYGGMSMVCGSCYIPKTNELTPEGEDAHFICADRNTIGLADGSIGSGKYARELMDNCAIAIHDAPDSRVDPMSVLKQAFSNTKSKGSSTACIITLQGSCLHAVSVGNSSGFLLFRENKFLYKSRVQTESLDGPYPPIKIAVMSGDIVIAGTDGLFHNVSLTLIEKELSRASKQRLGQRELAFRLAESALRISLGSHPCSSSYKAVGFGSTGGMIGDLTVIVGQII